MRTSGSLRPITRPAFTLIELLVVVAIIALLISILLPSLHCAREQAKAAKCGVQLRSLGAGLMTYCTENNDWIPGRNTTGIALDIQLQTPGLDQQKVLNNPANPVQTYDWVTPLLRHETELGNTREERFRLTMNRWACPSVEALRIDNFFGLQQSPDKSEFNQGFKVYTYRPVSYLQPAHFAFVGQREKSIAAQIGPGRVVTYKKARVNWEAYPDYYQPQLNNVGMPARKIAAADGTRFLTDELVLDYDVNPRPDDYGAFTTSGAWWAGSTAYGVANGSQNWDGQTVSTGGDPPHGGRGLSLSYRHGCIGGAAPVTARDNRGAMNALFFDGHVENLDDRASRNIEFWYPKGTIVRDASEGMTMVPDHYEVP